MTSRRKRMKDLISIENKILAIRNHQVMIDRDLAELYGIETKVLKQAVKRNIERFPENFMFQLTKNEFENWRSQFVTSNADKMGLRHAPFAFTEQGVAMLSAVLHSETAIKISIEIMNAFVNIRHYLHKNAYIVNRVNSLENKVDIKLLEYDKNFSKIFNILDSCPKPIKQDIFAQGQIFDAYAFFQGLIQKAQKEIILIDNYIDLTVLERLSKKNKDVKATIYTRQDTPVTKLDIKKFNDQYPTLTLKFTTSIHDRFLIIDDSEIYFIGASIKDLGKKCFAFNMMDSSFIFLILKEL